MLCYVLGLKGVFLTAEGEMGYRIQTNLTSGELSDAFQNTVDKAILDQTTSGLKLPHLINSNNIVSTTI